MSEEKKPDYLVHKPTGRLYPYHPSWEAREDFRAATPEEVKAHMAKVQKKSAGRAAKKDA